MVASSNKKIAKNTFILYFKSIALILISLYSSRVILQALGVEDYGIYNIVGGVVALFAMLNSSMSIASQRFISYSLGKNDIDNVKDVFSTSVALHIILGVIVVILVEIIGVWFLYNQLNIPEERLDVAFWVLQFSAATVFVNVNCIPYSAVIIAHEKMSSFAYVTMLNGLLKLIIAISLLWVSIDRLKLYAALMFSLSIVIWVVYYLYTHTLFEETRNIRYKLNKVLFKEMFSFAGWNLVGSSSNVLKNHGLDILLNLFFGVTVNAAKSLCNQVIAAVDQFLSNLQVAASPQLTMSFAQKNNRRVHFLIIHGSRASFFLVTLFAVPLIVSTPQILSIWLVEVPNYTVEFIRWSFLYLLLDCFSRFLAQAILSYGQIKQYQIIVGGTKLLVLPISYVWFLFDANPLAGIWVTLLVDSICLGERIFFNCKYHALPFFIYLRKVIIQCWLVFGISIIPVFIIEKCITSNILVLGPAAFFISFFSILFVGLNNKERLILLQNCRRIAVNHLKT